MTTTSTARIAFASFIGTAIEFYDFYIYGLAVAMVIGPIFFPGSDPAAQALSVPHLRHRVSGTPARRLVVRTFRRPHRTQDNLGRFAVDNGCLHDSDRRVAKL
jgi:hypothetical protein